MDEFSSVSKATVRYDESYSVAGLFERQRDSPTYSCACSLNSLLQEAKFHQYSTFSTVGKLSPLPVFSNIGFEGYLDKILKKLLVFFLGPYSKGNHLSWVIMVDSGQSGISQPSYLVGWL